MLIPSIDLANGRIVQLVQGERLALASDDIEGWIARFSRFPMVQVIDLDAARNCGSNRDLVRQICDRLPCQVGGGLRSVQDADEALAAGARRVIVGSALFDEAGVNPRAARQFADGIGAERLIGAVDGRGGRIAVAGWQRTLAVRVTRAMAALEPFVSGFLATLIDDEGLMNGVDMTRATELRCATERQLIVAGGIRSLDEVRALDAQGIDAVVGMAIYTGALSLDRAAES
jgi:phosphoribosylformimino-5-aminoimidazole carboxamide ribotide isomerase